MEAENREQVNAITAFVDASNVYGSSPAVQSQLRAPTQGQLKISDFSLLPVLPILDDPATSEHTAGDIRARENPGLAGLHTIFVREHNRIANYYATMTSMSHEMIYQLTRRIVGAQMQNVVYGQFLTAVLGQQAMDDFNLSIDVGSCYNENLDPSIFNSFATAAFRFGHSLIQGLIEMVTLSGNSNSDFKLRDNFFDMTKYVQSDGSGMEEILFALIQQKAQTRDQFATEDVTNFLFANIDAPGSDLIARNIHRGRDHGLPGYNDFREKACNLPISCDWNSPPSNIPPSSWAALKQLYKNPGDIDLFTGSTVY